MVLKLVLPFLLVEYYGRIVRGIRGSLLFASLLFLHPADQTISGNKVVCILCL